MKISKKSWHYKLNTSDYFTWKAVCSIVSQNNTISLCPYFWLTMLSCLFSFGIVIFWMLVLCVVAFVLFAALHMLIFMPIMVAVNVGWVYFTGDALHHMYMTHEELIISSIIWVAYGIATILLAIGAARSGDMDVAPKYVTRIITKLEKSKVFVVKNKEPSLLRSFLKAKKEKVCPLIEFVE